jgi:hypothetical protein
LIRNITARVQKAEARVAEPGTAMISL